MTDDELDSVPSSMTARAEPLSYRWIDYLAIAAVVIAIAAPSLLFFLDR